MRTFVRMVCVALLIGSLASAKEKKIHGYVTAVNSPTSFEIEDFKITSDSTLVLDLEKDEDNETIDFHPEDIRVGTELEIKGEYNEETSELKAKSIKVFFEDSRKIKRTALLERLPQLQKSESGWTGAFLADGQRVIVEPSTLVLFRMNKAEKKAQKQAKAKTAEQVKPIGENDDSNTEARPLQSLDQIDLDTFMSYQGRRQKDGTILATRVEFKRNELEDGEAKLWKKLTPKAKDPNYTQLRPGEVKLAGDKYKLLASKEAQQYVQKIGESLIPEHQKGLPVGNPLKIPFRFYVIQDKHFNAGAYPNGTVIVHSGLFSVLENEAQFAAVLGHEIAHAVQEHYWRQHEYHKKKLMALRIGGIVGAGFGGRAMGDIANMIEGAIRNGYSRSLENQADRVGLEYMLQAGYDIREAPRVWKVVTKKQGDHDTNFFWSRHDNNTTRRSYLMAELRNNYSEVDYSTLKTGTESYQEIAQAVKEALAKKQKVKVKY